MNGSTVQYAEHVGRFWESVGGNRGQGKILGWLLICDPPHQSASQVREMLHMSAGAVSTNVRVLEGLGLVERVTFPRDRATYYRVAADAWDYLLDEKQRGLLGFRRIAEEGAAVLEGTSPERAARLEALIELLDFMDVEYPKLVERWHTRKEPR